MNVSYLNSERSTVLSLKQSKLIGLVLMIFLFGNVLNAATKTYIGPNNGDWNTASNWSPNSVPNSTDDVIIPSAKTVKLTAAASANSVTVDGVLTMNFKLDVTLDTLLIVVTSTGTISFDHSTLRLPSTVSLYLQNGTNSLSGDCNNNDEIFVGTVQYGVCTGGGATHTFSQIESDGGIQNVSVGSIGDNQTICSGSTPATLTSTANGTSGSGTISYEWQTNASGSYATISGAVSNTYSPSALTTTTSYRRRTVCLINGSAFYSAYTSPVIITVNARPTPSYSVQPGTASCIGTDVMYTTQGGMSNYVWTVPGVLNTDYSISSGGLGTTSSTVILKWLTSGSKTVTVNYTSVCSGISAATNTTVVGALPNDISSGFFATTICAGGSPQLTFDAEDASFSAPYSITYKNDTTLAQYTIAIPSASAYSFTPGDNPTSNTSYTLVSISNASCTRTTSFANSGANLIVRPVPTATISGTTNVCVGTSSPNIQFTNPQTVAVTVTYTINGGGSQTINIAASSSSNVAVSTAASGSFVYNLVSVVYQSTPTCSNVLSGSATVTVNSLSVAPTGITGTTTICNGASTTLTLSGGTAGTGATAEWFTGSCGGTSAGTGNSIMVSPTSNTIYYVRYNGTCNTTACASQLVTVNSLSVAPTGITGTTTICNGASTTLTLSGGTAGTGATAEWFTGSCGGTSAGTGNSITVSPTSNTIYYVRYNGTCNTTTCASTTVTVNPLPVASGTITGTVTVCQGQASVGYSVPTITNATSYNWTYSGTGVTITNGTTRTPSITFASNAISGNLTVYGIDSCGNGVVSANYTITVQVPPSTPTIGTITQPNCITPTGSIILGGLPASGTINQTGTSANSYAITGTTMTIFGLATGTYNFSVSNGTCPSAPTGNVVINSTVSTSWTATGWDNGVPSSSDAVSINANYSASTNGEINVCSLTINSGASLTIEAGKFVTIQNNLTVNVGGTLNVLDQGSLVMVNDLGTVINNGTTNVLRTTTPYRNYDYVYWSTPVATTNIPTTFSGWKTSYSFEYKPENYFDSNGDNIDDNGDDWVRATTMTPAKGFIVMGLSAAPTTTSTIAFNGKVNNGIQKVTGVITNGSYLIGNPYPGAINADEFLFQNKGVLDGTLAFWTHNTAIQLASNITGNKAGSGTYAFTSDDYAYYNLTGGVGTGVGQKNASGGTSGGVIPNGQIGSCQGFFATTKGIITGTNDIVFNNSMRLSSGSTTNTQFFKTKSTKAKTASSIEKNRVWLNLTNEQGAFKQTLVGYITGATNDYEGSYDGETLDANEYIDFYSVNQNKKFAIQGRALPFDENDEVAIGFKTGIKGEFSISVQQVDGLLINQAVFIEDKLTNTEFDLKSGNYTFNTEIGTFNNRFVLKYKASDKSLGTAVFDTLENTVLVSVNKLIKINSFAETIDKVLIYDELGRQIYQKDNVATNEFMLKDFVSSHQVLVVKIILKNGSVVNKKIIF